MLRHAETPKGSRRVPYVLPTVHSRPVTRSSGSAWIIWWSAHLMIWSWG